MYKLQIEAFNFTDTDFQEYLSDNEIFANQAEGYCEFNFVSKGYFTLVKMVLDHWDLSPNDIEQLEIKKI